MDEAKEQEAQQKFNAAMGDLDSQLKLIYGTLEQAYKLIEGYAKLGPMDNIVQTLVFAETAFALLIERGQQDLLREICQKAQGKCKAEAGEDYLQNQLGDDFWNRVNFQTD